MNVSVGLIEGQSAVEVELTGAFIDTSAKPYLPGRYRFTSEVTLAPSDVASCAFALDNVAIGIGFHWERKERQVFRGAFRLVKRAAGLAVINDISLEEYVTSVISSEMSASCPLELLKAHAVISRSWMWFPKANPSHSGSGQPDGLDAREILRWYGREAHPDFDVCADDHCQRYQGITKAFSPAVAEAVRVTAGEFLRDGGAICDARFSKCCGGITERYATAWEDEDISYLSSMYDGPTALSRAYSHEMWIRSNPQAYCNTDDSELLSRLLPGFDQETRDFYRWRITYSPEELADLIGSKLAVDLGPIRDVRALARGPSGRIYRLKVTGERDYVILGKELEIRRALSRTHLYSSAFVVDIESGSFVLRGAGWGHGVGLCQIGAAVMANEGKTYTEILQHYYSGTTVSA
ncbi:MAG: SpoIID/LytB domain-containing protein [Candidatus Binataceae bacterium]|nr:SpoIID/LytB domain-containing protein [Candidatus Binataceae bacterium]